MGPRSRDILQSLVSDDLLSSLPGFIALKQN